MFVHKTIKVCDDATFKFMRYKLHFMKNSNCNIQIRSDMFVQLLQLAASLQQILFFSGLHVG